VATTSCSDDNFPSVPVPLLPLDHPSEISPGIEVTGLVGSAGAAAGGAAMALVAPGHTAPARRLAVLAAALDLVAGKRMERRMGLMNRPDQPKGASTASE
jgi:hypothetical protein